MASKAKIIGRDKWNQLKKGREQRVTDDNQKRALLQYQLQTGAAVASSDQKEVMRIEAENHKKFQEDLGRNCRRSYLNSLQEVLGRSHIQAINFSLLTDEDLIKMDAVEINYTSAQKTEGPGSLHDPCMGAILHSNTLCGKCSLNFDLCPGHPGRINLNTLIFHPGLIRPAICVLRVTCHSCSKLLIDKDFLIRHNLLTYTGIERLRAIAKLLKTNPPACPVGSCNGRPCLPNDITEYKAKESEKLGDIRIVRGKDKVKTTATFKITAVRDIFNNISQEDAALMGYTQDVHPRQYIRQYWPILPHCARMQIPYNGQMRVDQIDLHYKSILQTTHDINLNANNAQKINELRASLYNLIYQIGFGITKDEKNAFKSLKEYLGKKQGLFRAHLCSARQPYCARAVICMDSSLAVGVAMVSEKYAQLLNFEVPVTHHNIKRDVAKWQKMGVIEAIKRNGVSLHEYRTAETKDEIRVGDVIVRQALDDDYLLFVRQPVLTKHNFMGWRIRICRDPTLSVIKINLAYSEPYNYDFDGDEMTLFAVPSEQVRQLTSVYVNAISSIDARPVPGLFYNAITMFSLLSSEQQVFNRVDFSYLLSALTTPAEFFQMPPIGPTEPGFGGDNASYNQAYAAWQETRVTHNNKLAWAAYYGLNPFSNRALISCILPHDLYYQHKEVLIEDGVLLVGKLTDEHLKTGPHTIFQTVHQLYWNRTTQENQRSIRFLDEAYQLINRFLDYRGHSLSINSLQLKDKSLSANGKIIMIQLERVNKLLANTTDPAREAALQQQARELHAQLIDIKDNTLSAKEILNIERENLFLQLSEFEDYQTDPLAEKRRQARNEAVIFTYENTINQHISNGTLSFRSPNMIDIITSGAKGSLKSMSQASVGVGQQFVGSKTLYTGLTDRLPGYGRITPWSPLGKNLDQTKRLNTIATERGMTLSNYLEGIDVKEQFFSAPGGRVNIADTNLTTPYTGYLSRKIAMSFLDVSIYPTDGTIRVVTSESKYPSIISFSFGDTFKVEETSLVKVKGRYRKSILKLESFVQDYNRQHNIVNKSVILIITGDQTGQVYNQMLLSNKYTIDSSLGPNLIMANILIRNIIYTIFLVEMEDIADILRANTRISRVYNLDPSRTIPGMPPHIEMVGVEDDFDITEELEDYAYNL